MSEAQQGMLTLVLIAVGSAILFHTFVRSYAKASGLAAVLAAILFQIAATIHIGHIDPFALVALITSGLMAWVIALVIGIPFRVVRARTGGSVKR